MAKYRVSVNETSFGSVVVDADDEDDVREKAAEEYHRGNVFWTNSDIEIFDIKEEC